MLLNTGLPVLLPRCPKSLVASWYEHAVGQSDEHSLMVLATATLGAVPSARIVRCVSLSTDPFAVTFCTSANSRKAAELQSNPRAAAVFYWPYASRQLRLEGEVEPITPEEADAWFETHSPAVRVALSVANRAGPLQAAAAAARVRPGHLGGFRLFVRAVELAAARIGLLQERARWLARHGEHWQVQRL